MGGLNRDAARANTSLQRMQTTSIGLGTALRTAGLAIAALGLGKLVGGTIATINSFEQLQAQLKTVTGSADEARIAFAQISEFAKTTPFQLDEVTKSFTILKRMGIDTSTASLKAFGNIAAANGKSFTQLSEAVADAMTGEFERLKEFGIKVKQENGKFIASMGDTEVAVSQSASGMIQQLRKLGEEGGAYATGMEDQAKTLGGMFSNLQDNIAQFAATVGSGGLSTALKEVITLTNDLFNGSSQFALKIGAVLGTVIRYIVRVGTAIVQVFSSAFNIVSTAVTTLYDTFYDSFKAIYDTVYDVVKGIVDYFGLSFDSIGSFFYDTVNDLIATWHLFGKAVWNVITNLPEVFIAVFKGIGRTIIQFGESAVKQMGNIGEAMWMALKAPFTDGTLEDAWAKLTTNAFSTMDLGEAFGDMPEILSKADIDRAFQTDYINKALDSLGLNTEASRKDFENLRDGILTLVDPVGALNQIMADYNELLAAGQSEQDAMNAALQTAKDREAALGGVIPTTTSALEQQAAALGLTLDEFKKFNEAMAEFGKGQTALDDLTAGIAAFNDSNVLDTMQSKYASTIRGLDLLRSRDKISEEKYLQAKADAHKKYANEVNAIQLSMFEEQLRTSGVVNDEIINVSKQTMAQAQMVTQGGVAGIQGALGMLNGFLTQAGKMNKDAFEAQKAVAIAQTIISTYQAATQAFAAMSVIPIIGPALGFAAAATIVAAGMANVSAIRNQSYSGRSLGGPVMNGESYIVGENGPEMFTPTTSGSITRNGDLGNSQPVQVTFNINAIDTQGIDELLISRRAVIEQVISDAMVESGQRSRF